MPVSPTYPGVYVQELPSGTRTIAGVATSTTAFVGRALRGPTDEATLINSWGEFERTFGGLWKDSAMSYAVYQYYRSGGRDAVIVRVANGGAASVLELPLDFPDFELEKKDGVTSPTVTIVHVAGSDSRFTLTLSATSVTTEVYSLTMDPDDPDGAYSFVGGLADALAGSQIATLNSISLLRPAVATAVAFSGSVYTQSPTYSDSGDTLLISASAVGVWGDSLRITIDHDVSDTHDPSLFNLLVEELDADSEVTRSESHRNLSLNPAASRFIDTVLEQESNLIVGTAPSFEPQLEWITPRPSASATPTSLTSLAGGDDGDVIDATDVVPSSVADKQGIYALEDADIFNLLCLPPLTLGGDTDDDIPVTQIDAAITYCESRRAVMLVDCPASWTTKALAYTNMRSWTIVSSYGAMYFPRLKIPDPLRENRLGTFAPCGVVAGLIAKNDGERGLWKAPAGLDVRARVATELVYNLTDGEHGTLNPLGLNCFRRLPSVGHVVWGARTLEGADRLASQWKYLPVRRTALYIEESLYRGLQWAVFEPNDEPLWAQIRMNAGTFMHNLFRQSAFQGTTPKEAYFVKCDSETTTQADVDLGIVNVIVGFAPLKPAEFVIISIQQMAGQSSF